jgi:hypothetical protein
MEATTTLIERKDFITGFFLVIFYVLGFYGLQFFLYNMGMDVKIPTDKNLYAWDVGFYQSIAYGGYVFKDSGCNSGFFFLFPLLWHILHLGIWGVCIMNVLLFATGFSLLTSFLKLGIQDKLVWLTVPAFYFVFIPYSEALFFFLAVLCIIGIEQHRMPLVWVSIFLLSLTRATTLFMIPAFLIMQLVGNERKLWRKAFISYLCNYLVPSIIGFATFVIVQFVATGVWFAYFKQQSIFWERKFTEPVFPLSGYDGSDRLIWLNALALFICFVSLVLVIRLIILWALKGKTANKSYLLSLVYLSIILYIIIFYNPKWGTNTTLVIGAIRYALVNPFFYIFLYYNTIKIQYTWVHFTIVFLVSSLFWMVFGSYKHIDYQLFFTADTVIIFFYMFYANRKLTWPAIIISAINIFFQVMLFQQFIKGQFPDG